jgi:sialate O-acetylesterase
MILSRSSLFVATTLLLLPGLLRADVKPAALFTDHAVLQRDVPVPVWGTAVPGEVVRVSFAGQERRTTADASGRWMVRLDRLDAGGPFDMTIAGRNTIVVRDVLVGEVWLCSGQSNMDFTVGKTAKRSFAGVANEAVEIAAANHPQIRHFSVPFKLSDVPQTDVQGHWKVCTPENVPDFSAVAYFFARALQQELKVPIGLVTSAFGASTAQAWISREALAAHPELAAMLTAYDEACAKFDSPEGQAKYAEALKAWEEAAAKARAAGQREPRKPANPHQDQHNPCVLYNGMLSPLAPFAIRGAIWYQGESNGYNSHQYLALMTTLIADWRRLFAQGEFPFLFVQLANYRAPSTQPVQASSQIARVREAQRLTLQVKNTAMAVAIDIGDEKDVHPRNKQEVGRRLALAALARVYGKTVAWSGPTLESVKVEGDSIRLLFAHADGGLKCRGEKLTGFAVAGEDGVFHFADARIDGNTVVVSSPAVRAPKAVRYGWADNPPASLYNAAGLPASPFKTD